jgi:hypothetical protein
VLQAFIILVLTAEVVRFTRMSTPAFLQASRVASTASVNFCRLMDL